MELEKEAKEIDCNGKMMEYIPDGEKVIKCCQYRIKELNGKICEHLGSIIFIDGEARKKCLYKKK